MTEKYFTCEGNNGGDYLTLRSLGDRYDGVHLEVGHCCVVTVDDVMPVELLTSALTVAGEDGFLETARKRAVWSPEFIEILAQQYKSLRERFK